MNQPIHHIVTLEVPTAHLERIAAEIEALRGLPADRTEGTDQ